MFFIAEDGITRFLNIDLVVENYAEIDYIETPFRYRWAFVPKWEIDLALEEIQQRFGEVDLPDAPRKMSVLRHNDTLKSQPEWAANQSQVKFYPLLALDLDESKGVMVLLLFLDNKRGLG